MKESSLKIQQRPDKDLCIPPSLQFPEFLFWAPFPPLVWSRSLSWIRVPDLSCSSWLSGSSEDPGSHSPQEQSFKRARSLMRAPRVFWTLSMAGVPSAAWGIRPSSIAPAAEAIRATPIRIPSAAREPRTNALVFIIPSWAHYTTPIGHYMNDT